MKDGRMNRRFLMSTLLIPLALISSARGQVRSAKSTQCPVTIPRKAPDPPGELLFGSKSASWNGALFVGGLGSDGIVLIRPDSPDLSMKFGWYRGAGLRGKLAIQGKRLDGPAPPLSAHIPDGYGETGFQSSGVIFPTEGCWEVTGKVGTAVLTFVTRVVKGRARHQRSSPAANVKAQFRNCSYFGYHSSSRTSIPDPASPF